MRKVDPSTIQKLSERIQGLPAVEQPRGLSEALAELAPLISAARSRGQDLEVVRQLLEEHGIRMTRASLLAYLRQAPVTREKANPARAATSRAPTQPLTAAAPRAVNTKPPEAERAQPAPRARGTFEVVPDSIEI